MDDERSLSWRPTAVNPHLVLTGNRAPGRGNGGTTRSPGKSYREINHRVTLSQQKGDSSELPERRLVAGFSAADVDEPGGSAFSPLSSAGRSGGTPVLVFAEPLLPHIQARLQASGAVSRVISYARGALHYYRELRKLVKAYSITVAHIVFFDYFSALPWIARLSGIRRVVYEMQNSGEFRARSWKRALLRFRTQVMTYPTRRVIASSAFVKEQLVNAGVEEAKVTVRYLGVNTERFIPDPGARTRWAEQFSVGPNELILSTVSYLRPFKHPEVLVQACHELAARGIPVRLFVAGDGEMLPDLRTLSARLGVADRICWLGNVAEPKALLQASDIFLLASVGEAFGLVLAEAMACGVPIVGSRSGSLTEVVEEKETGLLAPSHDAAAFADSVEQLARDGRLRKDMGHRALERVRQNFTVDRDAEGTLETYALL
jgi:glycosyltransferase involved in cell wall biosynthesis